MKTKRIGMRNVKTALSVALCIALSQFLNRQDIFYAAIAAVMAMQSSVSDSFKAGKNRMLGTMFGAFIGLIFALIHPDDVLLCGIGVILIIYVCDLLDWNKSITISCTVFLVIMLNLNGRSPVSYSMSRIIDTFIGITIAVLVNYFIAPPKHLDKIYTECILAIDKVFDIVRDKFCNSSELDLKTLEKEISTLEEALNIYLSEFRIKQIDAQINKLNEILDICKNIHMHLKIIQSLENDYSLSYENYLSVKELFRCDFEHEEKSSEAGIVYNYHVNKTLKGLYMLKDLNKDILYS